MDYSRPMSESNPATPPVDAVVVDRTPHDCGQSGGCDRNDKMVIGAVSYLNTKPLIAGLDSDSNDYKLQLDLPSRLADQLADGQLDVALVPVIEAIQDSSYIIVSDACIACHGPVWSVKLMSRVSPEKIRTLALDEGSRTSQALTRILLAKQYGVTPQCQPLPMNQDWRNTECDAALVIGDRAMNAEDASFPFVFDLGTEWKNWTGLPFVFAVWAARADADLPMLDLTLKQSRDYGLTQLSTLAKQNSERYALSDEECFRYIDHYIHYNLGDEEKRGMQVYFDYAAELSLIPEKQTLNFFTT